MPVLFFFHAAQCGFPMLDQLLKDPRFLPELFEILRDGLMVVNDKGLILLFNRAAEEITGYRKADVLGKECTLFGCDACVVLDQAGGGPDSQLEQFGAVYSRKSQIRAADGRMVPVLKNAVVLRDETGKVLGAIESLTDIT